MGMFSLAIFLILSLRRTTKMASRAIFVAAAFCLTTRLGRAAYICELIHYCMGSEKTGCVACCCVVSCHPCVNWP